MFRIEGATKSVRDKPDPLTLDELVAVLAAASRGTGRCSRWQRARGCVRASWWRWTARTWTGRCRRCVRGTKTAASADVIPITPLALRELARRVL
ncbi:MAG: hypothetical protein R3F59_03625 [Myxococcota bacterium]